MCCCRTPRKGHTRSLLWKNFVLWRRTPCISALELLTPILLCAVLMYLRSLIDFQVVPSAEVREVTYDANGDIGYTAVYHYPLIEETRMNLRDEERWMESTYGFAGVVPRSRLMFIPRSCFWTGNYATQRRFVGLAPRNEFTESIEYQLRRWLTLWKSDYGYILDLEWRYFDSKAEMFAYVEHEEYMKDLKNRPGLCFGVSYSQSGPDEEGFEEHRFDLHFEDQPLSEYQNIPSQLLPPLSQHSDVPDMDSYFMYVRQGFNLMQNWCANALLRSKLFNLDANIISLIKPMQTNEFIKDDFVVAQERILPLVMVVVYLLPIYRLISLIVTERQAKTKDVLRSMGVPETAYWLSWFGYYLVGITFVASVQSAILAYGVFKYSDFGPILGVIWLYGLSLFGYSVFIQSLFSRPTLASIVGSLLFFVSSFAEMIVEDPFMSEHFKLIASLVPSVTIQRCFLCIAEYERQQRGLTLETLNTQVLKYHVSYGLVMMAFFFLFFSALGIYLSQVLPHAAGGFRQHPCFCLGGSYKSKRQDQNSNRKATDLEGRELIDTIANFERVDKELYREQRTKGDVLRLQNLTKTFDQGPVVEDLSLEMYGGEIFALLGHNGAGKTTTIKMVIGQLEASGGRIVFQKRDLALSRRRLHHQIGVCPQENILYDQLTVVEHFRLFSALRAPKGPLPELSETDQKIDKLIQDLDLSDYVNVLAKNLSGGNKRKLQVGLAFVGEQCSLVLLDEPTAGLDIVARRRMWDTLKAYKKDRVVILTTHYMDEAEILGDRIGIMAQGKLVCQGSTAFLTKRFGTGAKIILRVQDKEALEQFAAMNKAVAHLEPLDDAEDSVALVLPAANTQTEIAPVLHELQAQKERLGISSIEVAQSNLEQVFVQVATAQLRHDPKRRNKALECLRGQISQGVSVNRKFEFCKHAALIVKKRATIYRRSLKTLMLEILIPLMLLFTGFSVSKISFIFTSEPRELSPSLYGAGSERILINSKVVSPASDAELEPREIQVTQVNQEWLERQQPDLAQDQRIRMLQSSIFDFIFEDDPQAPVEEEVVAPVEEETQESDATDSSEEANEADISDEVAEPESIFTVDNESGDEAEEQEGISEEMPVEEDSPLPEADEQSLQEPTGTAESADLAPESDPTYSQEVPDLIELPVEESKEEPSLNSPTQTDQTSPDDQSTQQSGDDNIWQDRLQSTSVFALGQANPYSFEWGPALGDQSLTAEQFVAGLPNSRQAFVPKYLDFGTTVEDSGFQGRDTWQQMEREIYEEQFNDDLMEQADMKAHGSYFLYELNNSTKQFKVGTFVNTTQADSATLYPQLMYESIIRLATGDPKLKFTVVNSPLPITKELRDQGEAASAIFLVFVITISYALMQASTIAFVCHEKERKLKHMQFIQGMSRLAYWLVNFLFDLLKTGLVSLTIWVLMQLYDLSFPDSWSLLVAFPFAIVPFTYMTSFIFAKESTAQNCTIFSHLILGSILSSSVFVLRLVRQTEDQGDTLNTALKVFPSYALSSGLLYSSSKQLLNETREWSIDEIFDQSTSPSSISQRMIEDKIAALPPRTNVTLESYEMANLGGDLAAMGAHFIIGLVILIIVETGICLCRGGSKVSKDAAQKKQQLIQVSSLKKKYTPNGCCGRSAQTTEALIDTSFGVGEHECFSLLGENGAGKSTTFKILTREESVTSGQVSLLGKQVTQVSKELGYCPQDDILFDLLTVEEHLHFYARLRCVVDIGKHVDALIETLRLEKDRRKLSMNLSGGNKRKLSVGIALVGKPRLILLDEPSTGVDPDARLHMWQTIKAFQQFGLKSASSPSSCILLTTHSMEEAETLSTRLAIMTKGGVIACEGTNAQLKDDHGKSFKVQIELSLDDHSNEAPYDETSVDMIVSDASKDPLQTEIFNQVVWETSDIVKLLQSKHKSHLAMQVETQGVLCPLQLRTSTLIKSQDLWKWVSKHLQLLSTVYLLAEDSRVKNVLVHPGSGDTFSLEVFKQQQVDNPLTKADLIVLLGSADALEDFEVSETTLEQIFQSMISKDAQSSGQEVRGQEAASFSYIRSPLLAQQRRERTYVMASGQESQQTVQTMINQI